MSATCAVADLDAVGTHASTSQGLNSNAGSSSAAPARCDVAICGGGLAGLALAAALRSRGYDAHVFEAAPELRTGTGTMIAVGENGFSALEQLQPGISPKIMACGYVMNANTITVKPNKDAEGKSIRFPAFMPVYHLLWSKVQNALAELVPSENVHCGHRTLGYTEDEEQGLVRVHFKGQPDVEARLVVAADGVRSALRATLLPNDPGPRYLGQMGWNALLYNPDNSVVDAHGPGEVHLYTDKPMHLAPFSLYTFVTDAGGGYTFWMMRARFDEPAFTKADGASGVEGGSNPMVTDALPQLVGGGLGRPGSKARVEKMLEDMGYDHVLRVVKATPEEAIYERAMIDRVPLDELGATMHSKSGRVLLLGDSAHAMHSGPGQGARCAFEDACVLANLLDQHRDKLVGWKPADSALPAGATPGPLSADGAAVLQVASEYNEARLVRVCKVQRFSAESSGVMALVNQTRPQNQSPEQFKARFTEFFQWMNQFPNNPKGDPSSEYWKP